MLITNFASGELSKTLFGRTDLRQYYCGAARLENFDVIPTGGIKRRPGMERLDIDLTKEGRIIPFIVNRGMSFLLYLSPEAIQVFRVTKDDIAEDEFVMGEGLRLYETIDEIRDVQYAQNYDTMILCHEDYPPLEVKRENNQLHINKLQLSFKKTVVRGDGVTEGDLFPQKKDDETYIDKDWLTTENNYPVTVSFYNGRLVFAGTKNNPQMVFFSAIKEADKSYNFATNKIFLTEQKEYVTLFSKVLAVNKIQIASAEVAVKFVKPINEYHVDCPYFPPGTRIRSLVGDELDLHNSEMELSNEMIGAFFNEDRIEGELFRRRQTYDEAEIPVDKGNGRGEWLKNELRLGSVTTSASSSSSTNYSNNEFYIYYGVHRIQFVDRIRTKSSSGEWNYFLKETVELDDNIELYENEDIKNKIRNILDQWVPVLKKRYNSACTVGGNIGQGTYHDYNNPSWISNSTYEVQKERIIDEMFNAIRFTMKYELRSDDDKFLPRPYHGNPHDYSDDILPFLRTTQKIYVAFYTREIISDSYPTPDCGFTFEVASDMNDAIKWLAVNKGLIIGTESAEWIVPPEVHATSHYAIGNSRYGSDSIQGTAIGDATVFFQAGKKALVEYYIPQQDNNFRANNMALLSPQMLDESPAREFDFVSAPHIKLLITREDGTMATLLYERSTGTFAWARITTGPEVIEPNIGSTNDKDSDKKDEYEAQLNGEWAQKNLGQGKREGLIDRWRRKKRLSSEGKIISAAALPVANGNDDVYMVVARNGKHFFERLREAGSAHGEDVYLDCWKKYTGSREDYSAAAMVWDDTGKRFYTWNEKEQKYFMWDYVQGPRRYEHGNDVTEENVLVLKTFAPGKLPEGHTMYIGYPYTSVIRTMPAVHPKAEKNNINALIVRFLESWLLNMTSVTEGKAGSTDSLAIANNTHYERMPYTGVHRQLLSGCSCNDAQVELYTDLPAPVTVLTLEAEMKD